MYICTVCGHVGYPVKQVKGSFLVEVALWFIFLLPGLIYSIWRLTSQSKVCPKCHNTTMIPDDTPKGKELIGEAKIKDPDLANNNSNHGTQWKIIALILVIIVAGLFIVRNISSF